MTGAAYAGGLVGYQSEGAAGIHSSYSTASVSGTAQIGGLLGDLTNGSVTNSYSSGAVTRSSGAATSIGGLIGATSSGATATASYYDTTTSGCVSTSAAGTAQTTTQLQSLTGYTGIYVNWNVNLDGVEGSDYPWTFGTASQYPALAYGDPGDYDTDNDNYIDIRNYDQFNAIRYDLDADGARDTGGSASDWANRTAVFPSPNANMGCAACVGYELTRSFDLDTDGSGGATPPTAIGTAAQDGCPSAAGATNTQPTSKATASPSTTCTSTAHPPHTMDCSGT